MEDTQSIQIKGIRDGLLINLENHDWEISRGQLFQLIKEKEAFFKEAQVCLDIGATSLRVKAITQLKDQLSEYGIKLWGILSTSELTENNAKALGLQTVLTAKKEPQTREETIEENVEKAVFINRTLRAGYRVESRGHVVIYGDVNPGAEIVSASSIVVWGKLMGSAIAGVEGDHRSVVCALELNPTQLRIGEHVFPPFSKKRGKSFPEEAYIENDECKIDIWNKEKERK